MNTNASAKVTQTFRQFKKDDGLTKLEYFTAHIASGLAANTKFDINNIPEESKRIAWAIIHELNIDE